MDKEQVKRNVRNASTEMLWKQLDESIEVLDGIYGLTGELRVNPGDNHEENNLVFLKIAKDELKRRGVWD